MVKVRDKQTKKIDTYTSPSITVAHNGNAANDLKLKASVIQTTINADPNNTLVVANIPDALNNPQKLTFTSKNNNAKDVSSAGLNTDGSLETWMAIGINKLQQIPNPLQKLRGIFKLRPSQPSQPKATGQDPQGNSSSIQIGIDTVFVDAINPSPQATPIEILSVVVSDLSAHGIHATQSFDALTGDNVLTIDDMPSDSNWIFGNSDTGLLVSGEVDLIISDSVTADTPLPPWSTAALGGLLGCVLFRKMSGWI